MSRVRAEVEIDAPPERVWRVISDPRNLPRWDRRVRAVHGVPPRGLEEGSEYETELRVMGVRGRVKAHVRELRPPSFAEVELSGPLRAVVRTRLTALDGERTLLEQDVDYRIVGGPVGEVLGRALRRLGAAAILRRGTEAQKRQVEEEWG